MEVTDTRLQLSLKEKNGSKPRQQFKIYFKDLKSTIFTFLTFAA